MVNRVILIGNLGRDPEIRRLENGAVVAKFSIATNENYKDKAGEWQSQTEWHDIIMWRSLAERAEAQLKKGAQIYLEGKLTHRSWQDKDGNNRRTTEVVASYFRMVGGRRDDSSAGVGTYFPSAEDEAPTNPDFSKPSTTEPTSSAPPAPQPASNPVTEADDDLPF
jgi:single-strand DNA-binding protein